MTTKKFYSFANGIKVSDGEINKWLSDSLEELKNGKTHTDISSGDTLVTGNRYKSSGYHFTVSTCNGYSSVSVWEDEAAKDFTFSFCRDEQRRANNH